MALRAPPVQTPPASSKYSTCASTDHPLPAGVIEALLEAHPVLLLLLLKVAHHERRRVRGLLREHEADRCRDLRLKHSKHPLPAGLEGLARRGGRTSRRLHAARRREGRVRQQEAHRLFGQRVHCGIDGE